MPNPEKAPVKKYRSGPQDERERLWKMNRKEFVRLHIHKGDPPKRG